MNFEQTPAGAANASDAADAVAPADADRLLARWRALQAQQPHLHSRQAAAMLQVPEAALIASRVGSGAVRLAPALRELLAGIEHWRKLFIVTPNRLGVSIAILNAQSLRGGGDSNEPLLLVGDQHRIAIDDRRVHACYLFDDRDAHGHSLSLCWFDARGNGVGKLFLRSRRGQAFALPGLMAFALPEQPRHFAAEAPPEPPEPPARADHRTGTPLCTGAHAARLMQAALADAPRLQNLALQMTGGALASIYRGPPPAGTAEPQALHLAAAGCKLHLRPASAHGAYMVHDDDGRTGLRIDADDGSLTITPLLDAQAGRQWLDTLLEKTS